MSIDVTEHEPVCAMFAHFNGVDRYFYPDDLAEAREYAKDFQARPVYRWRGSEGAGPVFPWTRSEVLGFRR